MAVLFEEDPLAWMLRIVENSETIFVRRQDESGGWGTVALSELPPHEQAEHIARWINEAPA